MIAGRLLVRCGPACRLLASWMPRNVDDIGHDGARRRIPARAGAAERHFADHVAYHGDRIADAARCRKDLPRRHEMRADEAIELPSCRIARPSSLIFMPPAAANAASAAVTFVMPST